MAKGRPPSGATPTRERNARAKAAGYRKISAPTELLGPPLPDHPDWGSWHPRTLTWWDMWRVSPMATVFIGVDWDYLADTALVHSCFHHGQLNLAAELRLRTEKLGATARDRDRIRLEIIEPEGLTTTTPPMDTDRRQRLKVLADLDR